MIARITNFANKENQITEWDERIPWIKNEFDNYNNKIFDEIIGQFYLLLEKYPNCLKEEVIMKKYQELKKYAKDNKTSINNLYSYYNRVVGENTFSGDVKNKFYGIRVVPIDCYESHSNVTITSYNTTAAGLLLSKNELKLVLYKGDIRFKMMIEIDSTTTCIYDGKKKLIKHL